MAVRGRDVAGTRTGYFQPGETPIGDALEYGDPVPFILAAVSAQQVRGKNPGPHRTVFQNWGTGVVYLAFRQTVDVNKAMFRIPVDGILIDEPPFMHSGEWWAFTDVAGTVLKVMSA